jgi:nitronate monooxygenase
MKTPRKDAARPLARWVGTAWIYTWLLLVLGLLLPIMALVRALTFIVDRDRILVGRCFRIGGAWFARGSPAWRFQLRGGMPRDGRPYLVVANHLSMIDIPALCLFCTDGWEMKWIVKRELFQVPWLGWLLRLAGDIPVVRGDAESGAAASKRTREILASGVSVMVFPEATRSRNGVMASFHPGAFHAAAELGVPILPIAISGTAGCIAPNGALAQAQVELRVLPPVETAGRDPREIAVLANEVQEQLARAVHAPRVTASGEAPLRKLDRAAIEAAVGSGKRLLVQGAMGVMASDGLPGPIARLRSERFVPVGTISGVVKSVAMLAAQIERSGREAPGGYVGVNLMAAINKDDFAALSRTALDCGVSFVVQGAGISRDIVRWCREARVPFGGIVSSGRLAQLYEKWGADFLVAEGREAGGHLGDPDTTLEALLKEVCGATSLPVIAAGGLAEGADLSRVFAGGAAGVQLATRFIVSREAEVHPNFKLMHMGKTDADVVTITSTVKGLKARAVRNAFTERLAAGQVITPRSKRKYFGASGYRGRRKACIECLAEGCCTSRESGHKESFCISDALLAAAVDGDLENGLFYTGQSVTRIWERTLDELRPVSEIVAELEAEWTRAEARADRREVELAEPTYGLAAGA